MTTPGQRAFWDERLRLRTGESFGQAQLRDPWQRELVELIDGPAQVLMIVGMRGLGKSTLLAAIGIERVMLRRGHEVIVVANDLDQAKILFNEASGFVERDRMLAATLDVFKTRIENPQNGSRLRVITADAVSAHGLAAMPTTFLYDEPWGAKDRRLLDAQLSALPKSASQLIALTTAGFVDSPAWELWQVCKNSDDPAFVGWDSHERGVWPSWMDRSEMARQQKLLPREVYERLYLNRWTKGSGEFLTEAEVLACVDESLDPHSLNFPRNRNVFGGFDLGVKHDASVAAAGYKERECFVVAHIHTWYGSQEAPVSLESVQAHLHLMGRRIPRLRRVLIDPWQGYQMIERAKRAGLRNVEEFVFSSKNIQILSQALWNAFRSGNIRIPPYEPLIEELVSARVRESRYGWRVDHQSGGYSDHLIAVGLALVASIPDRGEVIVESPRDQWLIDYFAARVRHPQHFGLPPRSGLQTVTPGGGGSHPDIYSEIRLTQLLQRTERIGKEEAAMLRSEIRRRAHLDPWLQGPCMIRDDLEHELGDAYYFVHQKEENQNASSALANTTN